jgi:hypothetical protein
MARAAELFDSQLVLYGTLRAEGEVHQLEMFLLDAQRAEVQSHVSASIPAYDLSDASIENKAIDLLAQLWPLPTTAQDPVPTAPPHPSTAAAAPTPEPAERGKLRWGLHKPVPPWKWAGVGVSAGVMVTGAVLTGIGFARLRQPGGPLERELFKEAEESLTDTWGDEHPDDPSRPADSLLVENDIDPEAGGDLCARAEATPGGNRHEVTNADVAAVCREIDRWRVTSTVGLAMAVVGAVGVVTFTTLLFVHRGPAGARARVTPRPDGLAVRF